MKANAINNNTAPFIQVFPKKLKPSHGFIGEKIAFNRKGLLIEGTVVDYRSNTVIAEIPTEAAIRLDIDTNLTVINHKNYVLV